MARVGSGVLLAVLLGAGAYASCSSESSSHDEDGDDGAAGDSVGSGGRGVGGGGGSVGGSRGGLGGESDGGTAGGGGAAGGEGGEESGGSGAMGGSATGGKATGGTNPGGGNGNAAGSGGAMGGMGGSNGGKGGAGGSAGGPTTDCGNRRLDTGESCDDGGQAAGDGCDSTCLIEDGYHCQGVPSVCRVTICGDMITEGSEGCDDGNALPFDGCADCRREPSCVSGMACTSPCGDGIVLGSEACDDGNRRSGDGCSAACATEAGFVCEPEVPCRMRNGICTLDAPIVIRDFNRSNAAGGHPDFQPGFSSTVITGLVEPRLDVDRKPVLSSTASVANGFMHGASFFAQWFRNGAPASAPIPRTLVLWNDGASGFSNRWGVNGERWASYQNATWCSNTDCAACGAVPLGMVCRAPCPVAGIQACFAIEVLHDGNPMFFPIDTATGVLTDVRSEGKVPEEYGWPGWPWETAVATTLGVTTPVPTSTAQFPSATHNFHFTSELRFWFRYDANTTQRIDFTGDDDAWVFVNGRLAIDLGGWHTPLGGSVTVDAATYSVTDQNLYEVAVFHAERQTEGSSFRLGHSGMVNPRSRCRAQ